MCLQVLASGVAARPGSAAAALHHVDVLRSIVPEEMQGWVVLGIR